MRKRKGIIYNLEFTIVMLILVILVGAATVAGIGDVLDTWRLSVCKTQATTLDNRLNDYAKSHKGFKYVNKSGISYTDEKYNNHFKNRADYPMEITTNSETKSSDGKMAVTGITGYFGQEFGFTTTKAKEPFKFIYIPLDENGNTITSSSYSTNVCFYDLIYYDRKGNVYASPQSYRNLSTAVRKHQKGD